jgi:uncharacterized protein (DUF3084 family)
MATQVTLHQNGRDQVARRLTDTEVQKAQEAIDARNADIAKRFKEQKQTPGTEDALRRSIDEIQKGEPKYDRMTEAFADLTRQQLPQLKGLLNGFGALQSVTFKGVEPGGWDIYETVFEKRKMEFRIVLTPDGKTAGISLRPM